MTSLDPPVYDRESLPKIQPLCPYVGQCGGCSLQDLAYEHQVALKLGRLRHVVAAMEPLLSVEVVPAPDPWRYRNKAELSFSSSQSAAETRLTLGYHAARSFTKIVDLDDCLLLPEPLMRVARTVRELAERTGLPPYYQRRHEGVLRHLALRASRLTGQVAVCLVTTRCERAIIERLADELASRHPELAGVYWGINEKLADVANPDEVHLIRGEPLLADRVGRFTVSLHPLNFLQPNLAQAERLYDHVQALAGAAPVRVAWDVYCGIGLIAFHIAATAETVYGVDIDPANLELARRNAVANGVANVDFRLGPAEDAFADKRFWLTQARPDLIVVDPPRSGLHGRVIGTLLSARPKRIIYVSCNMHALARDVRELGSGFPRYRLRDVKAFDLFPQTEHLEVVALLER